MQLLTEVGGRWYRNNGAQLLLSNVVFPQGSAMIGCKVSVRVHMYIFLHAKLPSDCYELKDNDPHKFKHN